MKKREKEIEKGERKGEEKKRKRREEEDYCCQEHSRRFCIPSKQKQPTSRSWEIKTEGEEKKKGVE